MGRGRNGIWLALLGWDGAPCPRSVSETVIIDICIKNAIIGAETYTYAQTEG